jgi:hypothetical protein
LETCPDRVPAEACPLNEEGLAHRTIVSIEAIGEAEQPDVEDLLVGVQGRKEVIDHLVEEAEEERFVQVVFQPEALQRCGLYKPWNLRVERRNVSLSFR